MDNMFQDFQYISYTCHSKCITTLTSKMLFKLYNSIKNKDRGIATTMSGSRTQLLNLLCPDSK